MLKHLREAAAVNIRQTEDSKTILKEKHLQFKLALQKKGFSYDETLDISWDLWWGERP